jgi:hypothetical protein
VTARRLSSSRSRVRTMRASRAAIAASVSSSAAAGHSASGAAAVLLGREDRSQHQQAKPDHCGRRQAEAKARAFVLRVLNRWAFLIRSLLFSILFVRLLFRKRTSLVRLGAWLRDDRFASTYLFTGSRRDVLITIER